MRFSWQTADEAGPGHCERCRLADRESTRGRPQDAAEVQFAGSQPRDWNSTGKGKSTDVLEPQGFAVCADRLFIDRVEELVGTGGVRVIE